MGFHFQTPAVALYWDAAKDFTAHWEIRKEAVQKPRRQMSISWHAERQTESGKVRALDLREHAGKLWLICSTTSARSELLLAH